MAQLIKLEDYISRYEKDLYHYSSQYVRLKHENWANINLEQKSAREVDSYQEDISNTEEKRRNKFSFLKFNIFKRTKYEMLEEDNSIAYKKQLKLAILNEDELKQYFLDELYPFQIKWATSTLVSVSFVDRKYTNNLQLKYFLQRFPDTYFLMYQPVFDIQSAVVEADIIFISPIGIEIISLLEFSEDLRVIAGDERTWLIEGGEVQERILNPAISLRRTEKIIKSILKQKGIDFPIIKTILSKKNQILFGTEPYKIQIIDVDSCENWEKSRKTLNSPHKNIQLKATDEILQYCRTTSIRRPEWENEKQFLTIEESEK